MSEELPPDLVPAKVAARDLGCHVSTVYRAIHDGELPAWQRGHRYFVSRAEARALIQPVTPLRPEPGKDRIRTRAEELHDEQAARERLRASGARV